MWCRTCRQDVPGVAAATPGELRCVKCGGLLGEAAAANAGLAAGIARTVEHGLSLESGTSTSPPELDDLDDWELADAVGQVRRFSRPNVVHTAHAAVPADHARRPPAGPAAAPTAPRSAAPRGGSLAWAVLLAGLGSLVCGSVLLVWSVLAERTELWDLGLPVAIAGQAGLLVGLVLQLERVWQSGREAAVQLGQVQEQLDQVRRSAELLSVRSSPAQHFYTHLADGAAPQVLLADLKGQLDLLATRMAQR
jgi:uncharacterized membrane-anchored protein YhcB (DUF1043 family)